MLLSLASATPLANPIGYAGYVYLPDFGTLGHWLARHRIFDPVMGRWITRDPASYVDGMSLYLYARGNPWMFVDPMGLTSWFITQPVKWLANQVGGPAAATVTGIVVDQGITDTVDYVANRADNMAAGAAAGAGTGAATGAVVGAGVGALAGGVGALPGAGAGALAGGIGGAISGGVSGLLSPDGATALDTAKEGAVGGLIDGATAGLGTKFLTPAKVAGKIASGADEAIDIGKAGARSMLPDGESQLKHIFRQADGHMVDSAANRSLLTDLANNPAARRGVDAHGNQVFSQTLDDGTQVWVTVRDGVIQNGGRNTIPESNIYGVATEACSKP